MTVINSKRKLQTVLSTFEVNPVHCQDLVDHITELYTGVLKDQPGFISSSVHVNDARTRVANYTQWESRGAFQDMLRREDIRPQIKRTAELAEKFEPVMYDVVFVSDEET
ncbi:MAG: antibiotic biosynthesis monooxygenase [Halocynthiibacter sp.]